MPNGLTDPPKAFISYSWDGDQHKNWTKDFAARLRSHGVDVTLDQWELVPGDQLPKFMETAIRENSYVLILCTPKYKEKSDARKGGVGYEGDVMTAEVFTDGNHRKFIPILRSGPRENSMPSWLKGSLSVDLSGDPYSETEYHDLLATLHNRREQAPPVGKPPPSPPQVKSAGVRLSQLSRVLAEAEVAPVKIEGVILDEVGSPPNDGTPGSALYAVPFKLNRTPTPEWAEFFVHAWDNPKTWTTMHRFGTARVLGDRIVLKKTTLEEVKAYHRESLILAVDTANQMVIEAAAQRKKAADDSEKKEQTRREHIRKLGEDLTF